jgi:DNA-binding transcriptional regulator WhiA
MMVQCVRLAKVANIQKIEATQKIQIVHFVARGSTPVLKQQPLKMIASNAALGSILMAWVQTALKLKPLVKIARQDMNNLRKAKHFVCRARQGNTTMVQELHARDAQKGSTLKK